MIQTSVRIWKSLTAFPTLKPVKGCDGWVCDGVCVQVMDVKISQPVKPLSANRTCIGRYRAGGGCPDRACAPTRDMRVVRERVARPPWFRARLADVVRVLWGKACLISASRFVGSRFCARRKRNRVDEYLLFVELR